MTGQSREWVEVAQAGQDEEATFIAGFLESAGIPCEIEGPSGQHPLPENLGAFGVSRVMVPADRVEEARNLLAERERDPDSSLSDEDELE